MWIFDTANADHARAARRSFIKRLHAAADTDHLRCEMIFGELVSNAVRHAPGIVTIWLELFGESAILYVHDNGPGCNAARPFSGGLDLVRRLSNGLCVNRVPVSGGTQIRVVLPLLAA